MSVNIRVANAPCNFGIYAPDAAPVDTTGSPLDPVDLLDELAAAGYDGIDSGPIGYLGSPDHTRQRLQETGMGLAGGWVDLRYDDPDGFAEDLAGLDAALDVFAAAPVDDPRFAPRPTLACPATPERYVRPGLAYGTVEDWAGFASRVQQAADRCRERGLEGVFHHHLGTHIESAEEVERLLADTDVSLCLDTGHLYLAGGDPFAALRRWAPRIRQVHIKDGALAVTEQARAAGRNFDELVADGGFSTLGAGDIDPAEVVRVLHEIEYTGWVVVEQDSPGTGQDLKKIYADQRTNREALRKAGI